jgi:hypothetical protein
VRLPFLIIDKVNAEALAFNSQGRLLGVAPVLLGFARGDDSPAGIGERALSSIGPELRITPAASWRRPVCSRRQRRSMGGP